MATPPDDRNYYEVLHVSRDAPMEIIRGSYRALMQQMKHHPDLGGDAAVAAAINEAYAVLSDPERRAEYDARLDLIAQVAAGLGDTIAEDTVPMSRRVLDPFRECLFCEMPHEHGRVIEVDIRCIECGSPLSTADKQRIEPSGKRAVERIDKRQAVTFFTKWPQARGHIGHTEDISLNGLRLITKRDLIVGQRIKIVSGLLESIAEVSHAAHERHGWTTVCVAGVAFVTLRFSTSVGGFVSRRV